MKHDPLNPTEAFLRTIDVHQLLPQQEPFVLIGTLIHLDKVRTISQLEVKEDCLLVDGGCLSASGLIENIAQTCAARIGYVNKYIMQKDVQIGFIGAIRNFEVMSLPRVGETITTTVDVLEDVFGMTLAVATIECEGKTIATTEIKLAVKNGDEEQ